jgi:hypothetical protein
VAVDGREQRKSQAECSVGCLALEGGVKRKLFASSGPSSAAKGVKRIAESTASSRARDISEVEGAVDRSLVDRLKVR